MVGSGVTGLTAAYVISRSAEVTLFEADDRLGGHADTHQVSTPHGPVSVDTGFIVHNERTYPTLLRMWAELGVETQPSDMSMSVRSDDAHRGRGLEWAGALGPTGLFPTWRNAFRPRYLRMLTEIPRFHRQAKRLLEQTEDDDRTLAQFLTDGHFSAYFRQHFMTPLVACVWSCDPAIALEYPARYLFSFLQHHGMLTVFGSPQWRTVSGGSHQYVDKVAAELERRGGTILLGAKVTSLVETPDGAEITDGNGQVHRFDAVVVATHPDQALGMLAEPTPLQTELLTAMPYSPNQARLHTDASLMPRNHKAWASWNQWDRPGQDAVTVTYDMTRLMSLPVTDGTRYFVTLGSTDAIDPDQVIAVRDYAHPIYNPTSVAAQRRLPEIDTDRIVFAGAYHGWGFHEDGARSGAAAAERLGFRWPHLAPATAVATPQVYATTISHTRRTPLKHRFTLRSRFWLVDLDELPDHGPLGRFEARDHLGDPTSTIRANVEAFLAAEGVVVTGGRILMAANARAFGYCFNPISVFWCFDSSGSLAGCVVEVHNTYGDRHAYLVHPDEAGRALVGKEMYVSPFHGVDGHYELVVPVPGDELTICVRLVTESGDVFDASLRGHATRSGTLRAAPAAIRGAVLIRMHGVWLWARRLRVQPRPAHTQEGVR
ncbi:FAD-dependent oxidoreductase [Nocardioides marmorisolisilvae]|uniref:FAD-dependent oxidoreductase n=1 Tax=Nocardioides marmorisolisilvae TaxID=1542737 RepID=A0A3N0DXZ5_9ACTN|nr:FAD-dependent oxidoreductase [Nocardioides marmorisolisilvae]